MHKILFYCIALLCATPAPAQTETYDIVSYAPPANWKRETSASAVIYSRIDGGSWSQIGIYKSTASKGSIESDAQDEWQKIVLSQYTIIDKDETTKPETADGWSVISHSGVWQYQGSNVATILTTYSNGTVCLSVICNATAQPYLKDFKQLIQSLHLHAPQSGNTSPVNNTSIAGLWASYNNESSGFMNGINMLSGGYFRKEYRFNTDGTYQFKQKDFSVLVKEIRFVTETGNWVMQNNTLTLTPATGRGEWWSKAASGRTGEWGSRIRKYNHPLEKVSYTFEMKYLSSMENGYLILKSNKPTARDGRQSNDNNVVHAFNYGHQDADKSLIDEPPAR